MKEPNPLAAALADKMWRSGEVPPPGNNPQVLAEALKLNSNRGPQLPRAVKGGLMWGPEWAGLDTPVAETISPLAAAMIERGLGVGQFLPGIGDAIDVRDAFDYAGQAVGAGLEGDWGRLGTAGSLAAIAAMGALPGVDAPNVKQMDEAAQGIRAYHGSPHDFDQFSMEKIGTGEGAQAYGRGLYFAESEGVAKSYRDQLTQMRAGAATNQLALSGADVDKAIADTQRKLDALLALPNQGGDADRWARQVQIQRDKLADLSVIKTGAAPAGKMYEVNIAASPGDFLDWDKPFRDQPAKVKDALRAVLQGHAAKYLDDGVASPIGEAITATLDRDAVTQAIARQGIPGIKYLDAGSRAVGDGSRNYVVFDDKLISILRKYGIAGLLGTSALAAAGAKDTEASEQP